jgi:hypothetical protein
MVSRWFGINSSTKKPIYEHYNNSLDKSIVVHTKRSKLDNRDISIEPVITEESISVRNRQARSNKQLYQIVGQDFIVLDFFVGGISCGRLMSPAHETQSMREIRLLRGRLPRKGGGLTGMH